MTKNNVIFLKKKNYPMSSDVPMSMPLLPTLEPHLPSRSGARTPPASLNRLARMAPRYGSEMAFWKYLFFYVFRNYLLVRPTKNFDFIF